MADLTQRFPPELLAEILGHVPGLDVLRFKQVNRTFRDVIETFPLLQHKIDLCAAGLEYNAAAGVSLIDSQNAFVQYRSNLDSLSPTEERTVEILRLEPTWEYTRAAGGVYAIATAKGPVRLFIPGSASRRIPRKEWEIPLPVVDLEDFAFFPCADVIAFVETKADAQSIPNPKPGFKSLYFEIQLRTLSDGGHHPAVRSPAIRRSRGYIHWAGFQLRDPPLVSIASSRLAMLGDAEGEQCLNIWDWRSAQNLFEIKIKGYISVDFIDDYRLLCCIEWAHRSPPALALLDTGRFVRGVPAHAFFLLPHDLLGQFGSPKLLLEHGAHNPSPEESAAPFYQDPDQRILALFLSSTCRYLILRIGVLSKLLESREGTEIGWDEWKSHMFIPSVDLNRASRYYPPTWVSGCRLFLIDSPDDGQAANLVVYDFSMQGCAKHLMSQVDSELGGLRHLSSTGMKAQLPWRVDDLARVHNSHESIIFSCYPDDVDSGDRTLHIWTF